MSTTAFIFSRKSAIENYLKKQQKHLQESLSLKKFE